MMLRAAFAASALVLAAGCVSVLPEARPPSPRHLLDPVSFEAPAVPPVAWSLAVEDPSATRVYDTPKIALVRERGRLEYLAGGEWADRAPRLVQAALVRSFENSGRIIAVGDRTAIVAGDFVLQTDIRGLHGDVVDGRPKVVVSIYARLQNARGRVFAARLFERAEPATSANERDLSAAFDRATGETLREIVEWTLVEGARAHAARAAERGS